VIDGKFPKGAMTGVEVKDEAYLMKVTSYANCPSRSERQREAQAALKRYGYRGFISTEVRCTKDGKAYLIDPCCRARLAAERALPEPDRQHGGSHLVRRRGHR
jgi:hypothetical protein